MKTFTSGHYLLICVLVGASCACSGFFVGEKVGVKKGAVAGGWIAKSSLDAEKDMLLIIEKGLFDGQNEADIRRLMIGGLETYLPERMMLSAEPFSQRYDRFSKDQASIDDAVRRLRANRAVLKYDMPNQSVQGTPGKVPLSSAKPETRRP